MSAPSASASGAARTPPAAKLRSMVQVHETIRSFRDALAPAGGEVGFVPTMGYLHAGHR